MWTIAVYHQVSLFSLRTSEGTSTGGKSLLVPSPYSLKMALLDGAIRSGGVQGGVAVFPVVRDTRIALSLPQHILVNNCFVRIQKPRRRDGQRKPPKGADVSEEVAAAEEEREEEGLGPYIGSVSFREYVQYSGPIGIALWAETAQDAEWLSHLLPLINYLGKRGGFFQMDSLPVVREQLPTRHGYVRIDGGDMNSARSAPGGVLQLLDDWRNDMTFDQVNVYSPAFAPGKDRGHHRVVLPYHVVRSSHDFTLYQRLEER